MLVKVRRICMDTHTKFSKQYSSSAVDSLIQTASHVPIVAATPWPDGTKNDPASKPIGQLSSMMFKLLILTSSIEFVIDSNTVCLSGSLGTTTGAEVVPT